MSHVQKIVAALKAASASYRKVGLGCSFEASLLHAYAETYEEKKGEDDDPFSEGWPATAVDLAGNFAEDSFM